MTDSQIALVVGLVGTCLGGFGWLVKHMLAESQAMTDKFIAYLQNAAKEASAERAALTLERSVLLTRNEDLQKEWRSALLKMSESIEAHTRASVEVRKLEEDELVILTRINTTLDGMAAFEQIGAHV